MKKLKQIFRFDNKKKVITTLSLLLMILVCIAASYSFFAIFVNNNKSQKINLNTGTLHLVFSDNDDGINAKLKFEESVVKKFTIENIGTREASLSLDVKDLVNTYMNRSLTYNLSYSESENGEYKTIIPESNMPTSSTGLTQAIASELSVPAGDTYYYNLTIKLNSLDDVEQTPDLDAFLNTKFQVSDPLKYRYYTLKVDPNGGTWGEFTTPQEYKLKNNETKTVSGTPTRVGYAFKGWKLEGVSSEFKNNKFTMGISDAVLTAEWTPNKYTLTIDPNGGEYSGDTTVSIGYQETLEIADPTRTGYTFAGWSVENGTLSNKTFTQSELKNSKLTASWTPIAYAYKVVHRQMNTSGSGYTVIDEINSTANYGAKVTPTVNTYTGFTSPSAQTITIGLDASANVVTYDYKRNQYTLTIQPNYGNYNGSTSNSTVKVYYNGTTTLKTPTRTGYTFGGWEVTNGTVNDNNVFTQSAASNSTVKAKWIANNYDYITYHRQMNIGGSAYTLKDTVTGNAAFGTTVRPPVKSYTGFTSPAVKSLTINTTGNTVDYNYTRNQYSLTYNFDNGQEGGPFTTTLYYGESITLGTPTKRGYTFNGWELVSGTGATLDNNTFTMGSTNASIKAKWQKNKYPVIEEIYLMNVDGSTYTLLSSIKVGDLSYGSTFSNNPSDKSGFTTPDAQTITVTDSTNYVRSYYTRNQYTLTINPNGGAYDNSSSYVTQSLYYEQQITLSTPVRDGYNFTSWSKTGGSLSGSRFEMTYRDVTLTANYSPKQFTVTFNANGGVTPTGSKVVEYDSTYGELPTPTYTNYEFLGWYTAPSGGYDITENDKVLLTENQTLYAHWELVASPEITLKLLGLNSKTGTPNFKKAATTDETADGLYSMEDDYGTSYYFRGAVKNNYVKFGKWNSHVYRGYTTYSVSEETDFMEYYSQSLCQNNNILYYNFGYYNKGCELSPSAGKDMYWRIVRINGDGSLRLVYDGTLAYNNGTTTKERTIGVGDDLNNMTGDNAYIGYMYGTPGSTTYEKTHENINDSNLKKYVDTWYKNNIANTVYEDKISDTLFCNDKEVNVEQTTGGTGIGLVKTDYSPRSRVQINFSPKLKCTQKNDRFTVFDKNIGNGSLTYPIGLITGDEIMLAGAVPNGANVQFYLFNNRNNSKVRGASMSPLSTSGIAGSVPSRVALDTLGYINSSGAGGMLFINPVINIKPEYVTQMTGTGIMTDPYVIPGVN